MIGIKAEAWVICRTCDVVIDKTYGDLETHGKRVWKAIAEHRRLHRNVATMYRVIPAPIPRNPPETQKKGRRTVDPDDE